LQGPSGCRSRGVWRLDLVPSERLVQGMRDARCTWLIARRPLGHNRTAAPGGRDGLGKPLTAISSPWLDFNGGWLQDPCDLRSDGEPMDVLISGAGVAGPMTAYWLRRYGFNPTIVERAPSLATGGYKIDVRGTALDVLRGMDAHDAVVEASTQMRGAELVDRDGNVIGEMSGRAKHVRSLTLPLLDEGSGVRRLAPMAARYRELPPDRQAARQTARREDRPRRGRPPARRSDLARAHAQPALRPGGSPRVSSRLTALLANWTARANLPPT
jgi:monoamine oxidase